ncbi:CDP-alcohol phosphatidyltransferase family protein [Proteus myxofaciens]|uniref:CDP-diacylglycerol--glycerol-3-phosphate 3-phosphatidyltransferase n=1 Tax=Proteus myxofaciens ATCC 19692 TaxID=1354337 RepID=A0A198GER8_9GAMM|nr:CDP-alcohol phosphatidyltransferase family protein [Proteus myxofaciens]OAT34716.1 CDP-diacylglycerol--glycerol-3-phosphate 3-phosphatidyltransferase [Proteus myxofaciens ATCC 19692]
MNNQDKNRRPIKARNASWATNCSRWLQKKGATPNGISLFSILFAAVAGLFLFFALFFSFTYSPFLYALLLILGAMMIQGRLICNLLDGMVAVEGGMKSPSGAIYNELPDRIADTFIIIGIGYGLSAYFPIAATLGWIASFFAMLTAYVRVLGGSCGLEQQFTGPMAKQHRMALITLVAIITAFIPITWGAWLFLTSLWIIILGSILTTIFRTRRIIRDLSQGI